MIEGGVDPNNRIGAVTQSYQVAPFDVFYRPNYAFVQIPNYETTSINTYCGGPYQQAISGTTMLNNKWYDNREYQKYAFEYEPGNANGKIAWFVGDNQSFLVDGRSIGPNGNIGARQVSQEPMSMVMNLGMSNSWTQIFTSELKFPTIMHIDYVRIYQKAGETIVTCDPPGYPTTEYIEKHAAAYQNPNFTVSLRIYFENNFDLCPTLCCLRANVSCTDLGRCWILMAEKQTDRMLIWRLSEAQIWDYRDTNSLAWIYEVIYTYDMIYR